MFSYIREKIKVARIYKGDGIRKLSLDELIDRSEKRMFLELIICPFCNSVMVFRTSNIVLGSPTRDDIAYKCPTCRHTTHFGVPISKELANEEIYLRGSTSILRPLAYKEKLDNDIVDRLKALGYLDV